MPNLQTSIKDLRQNKRRKIYNDRLRKRMKRAIKKQNSLIEESKQADAERNIKNVYKVLDKAAKKNVIKKGKADRIKSRLTNNLNKLSQANVKTSKKGS
ncbi:MAG: 30S ribosomal protein S20 [Candidatus Dojkabacteria bacterium]|jgi:ribosomal protein S20